MTLVGNHFAGHLMSIVGRPLNLVGALNASLIVFFWLTSLHLEIDSLGIPTKGRIFNCGEQFGHFGVELNKLLELIGCDE